MEIFNLRIIKNNKEHNTNIINCTNRLNKLFGDYKIKYKVTPLISYFLARDNDNKIFYFKSKNFIMNKNYKKLCDPSEGFPIDYIHLFTIRHRNPPPQKQIIILQLNFSRLC